MYGVAALLGIAGRLDWLQTPSWLQLPWVIGLALVLFCVELVVDKIALLDSAWDAVHTFIRPMAGAAMLAGLQDGSNRVVVLAVGGALLALSSHSAKAATRVLVNASPEPVSNIVVSLVEDGFVAGWMAFAIAFPFAAGVVTLILAATSTIVAFVLFRAARLAVRKVRARRSAEPAGP
jgi:hypothetical protein